MVDTLQPGALVDGRYRLRGTLGEGGMGRVYEAEDIQLSRRVAIKVVRDPNSDDSLCERLYREAKAAARAQHPAVVTVYGYGIDDLSGLSYVAMELLRGETLGDRLARERPLDPAKVVTLGIEIADALEAVHTAGVVHRDLKPSNVFLLERGRQRQDIKLLDFGIAKHFSLQTLTVTGEIFGTLAYMAPEQLRDSKRIDARCDVYALGVLLYECLVGKLPYEQVTAAELVTQVLAGPPVSLAEVRGDLNESLIAIVDCCMQRERAERFDNARSVANALGTIKL